MKASLKTWFAETRPNFLVLSVTLVLLGSAAAAGPGFSWLKFALTLAGLTLMHVGCNVLNDYFDHRSGIDFETVRTPFSGGSGYLTSGALPPSGVFAMGIAALAAGCVIGAVLTWMSSWELLVIGAAGVFTAFFYNVFLSKVMLGEIAAGMGMGFLPVVGTYFVQRGAVTPEVLWLAVPAGLLTHNLLLLNEFPDAEADRKGGRRHMVIVLGPKAAGILYTLVNAAVFLIVIAGAALGYVPMFALISLLALPLAIRGAMGALSQPGDLKNLVPAQGANVGMVLVTQALLAAGVFAAAIL